MSTVTGIEKVYAAILTKDDNIGLSYGTPVYYEGIKELGIKPKTNNVKLYAENKLWAQADSFDSADVDIILASLSSAQRATLLGQTLAALGGVFAKDTDVAPYVALLYKATIKGGYRYGVLYKGMFSLPEDSAKGQEGKVEFQTPKISAVFGPTIYNGFWEYHVDTTDVNCPANIDTTWFTSVVIPTIDTIAPTLTSVPANNATGVAVDVSVVLTFSKAMDDSTLTNENIMLITSGGAIIAGTISVNAAMTVATFTPAANLSSGIHFAIVTTGVQSATGVKLASTYITKFTV